MDRPFVECREAIAPFDKHLQNLCELVESFPAEAPVATSAAGHCVAGCACRGTWPGRCEIGSRTESRGGTGVATGRPSSPKRRAPTRCGSSSTCARPCTRRLIRSWRKSTPCNGRRRAVFAARPSRCGRLCCTSWSTSPTTRAKPLFALVGGRHGAQVVVELSAQVQLPAHQGGAPGEPRPNPLNTM